jgi:hypothetical protein
MLNLRVKNSKITEENIDLKARIEFLNAKVDVC